MKKKDVKFAAKHLANKLESAPKSPFKMRKIY